MIVELMTPDDLPAVTVLAAQLGYPNSIADLEARFHEITGHELYALFVARNDDGSVLGWIQINAEPISLLVGPRADIAALVVDERHRSKGVGRELVKQAELWARERNFEMIRVRSNVTRRDAHRFYQREGYVLSKTGNIFTKKISLLVPKEASDEK
ncbi:MAG: GNAT family N-acetyltransferase [Oligoflexia bacterium]|nr:GNAT family N-acetyltransferase [Oligoflexia bacterium]